MAATALKTADEKKEYFDTPEELDLKVTQLAEWIKESKHFIAFTGAGISTSAGIPDYRSGVGTVLKTGPGAWEKAATGVKNSKGTVRKAISQALPTSSHMALSALEKAGYLKFLISQVYIFLTKSIVSNRLIINYRTLMVFTERVVSQWRRWLKSTETLISKSVALKNVANNI